MLTTAAASLRELPPSTIDACSLSVVTVAPADKITAKTGRLILSNDEKIVTACPVSPPK